MGDVIDLKPKQWTNDLLSLPECPHRNCSKCGRGIEEEPHVWMSPDLGCGACAPEMEPIVTERAVTSSHIFLLESAILNIYKAAEWDSRVTLSEIKGILRNHALKVDQESIVQIGPNGQTPGLPASTESGSK